MSSASDAPPDRFLEADDASLAPSEASAPGGLGSGWTFTSWTPLTEMMGYIQLRIEA